MIVVNKENFIYGSTVLAPKENENYKELKKSKNRTLKEISYKRFVAKLKAVSCVIIAFAIGFTVIYRYVQIYRLESNLASIRSEVKQIQNENEKLNLNIAMASGDMNMLEEDSINKLHMIPPDRNNVICIDLNKSNFMPSNSNVKKFDLVEFVRSKVF